MPEPDPQIVVTLLWVCLGLLVLLLVLAVAILRSLGRIGRRETPVPLTPDLAESALPAVETSPGGAFEAFLEEDPSRRDLTKGEQFKAYRKWRQEKGLNWSNS